MQTQPNVTKAPTTKLATGTCRKCWHALGESEICATCGEAFARVQWSICLAVMVGMLVVGGLLASL